MLAVDMLAVDMLSVASAAVPAPDAGVAAAVDTPAVDTPPPPCEPHPANVGRRRGLLSPTLLASPPRPGHALQMAHVFRPRAPLAGGVSLVHPPPRPQPPRPQPPRPSGHPHEHLPLLHGPVTYPPLPARSPSPPPSEGDESVAALRPPSTPVPRLPHVLISTPPWSPIDTSPGGIALSDTTVRIDTQEGTPSAPPVSGQLPACSINQILLNQPSPQRPRLVQRDLSSCAFWTTPSHQTKSWYTSRTGNSLSSGSSASWSGDSVFYTPLRSSLEDAVASTTTGMVGNWLETLPLQYETMPTTTSSTADDPIPVDPPPSNVSKQMSCPPTTSRNAYMGSPIPAHLLSTRNSSRASSSASPSSSSSSSSSSCSHVTFILPALSSARSANASIPVTDRDKKPPPGYQQGQQHPHSHSPPILATYKSDASPPASHVPETHPHSQHHPFPLTDSKLAWTIPLKRIRSPYTQTPQPSLDPTPLYTPGNSLTALRHLYHHPAGEQNPPICPDSPSPSPTPHGAPISTRAARELIRAGAPYKAATPLLGQLSPNVTVERKGHRRRDGTPPYSVPPRLRRKQRPSPSQRVCNISMLNERENKAIYDADEESNSSSRFQDRSSSEDSIVGTSRGKKKTSGGVGVILDNAS